MDSSEVIAPAIIGVILSGVGVWQLIAVVRYIRNAGKAKDAFRGWATWTSLLIGVLFTGIGVETLIAAIINAFK
ncbi:hypothetical protein ACFQHW_10010 [Lapidilactobacillus achengensis]|uniref:Uncharacterized protein n=1 Tax=Lapidilactobacillus achengensis TaxID=2486000 RepID=A0ABW1UTC4_9LACO|nr:hypothetical protein [Lapidilactobacillus achengensis]